MGAVKKFMLPDEDFEGMFTVKRVEIRVPIWKTRSVGISDAYTSADEIEVEITYKDKSGKRLYPDLYAIESSKLKNKPCQTVKGVTLFIVPISELRVKEVRC